MDSFSSLDSHIFWDRFLQYIEERVNVQSYNTWFKPLKLMKLDSDSIVIEVPQPYYTSWLEEHYDALLSEGVQETLEKDIPIHFILDKNAELSKQTRKEDADIVEKPPSPSTKEKSLFFFEPLTLNDRFTFDSFVVGNSNQFAYAAAKAVADSPGTTAFNPLVIYSGVGLGKTHITQAIANHYIQKFVTGNDDNRVIYVSSEKFTMDFIMSIQNNMTPQYSTYYRNAHFLLVDDIQFFNNKERTQEEFFHIFNALHQKGKQIVLTMDRPPGNLKGLADRLINRFQWGLVTDIQPPDFETRVAILQKKAEVDGVNLANNIAEYIASNISSNIRQLEGSLIRLLAYSSLYHKDMSIDLARNVLGETFDTKSRIITIESLQKLVAGHFSISENKLIGNSRRKEIAIARHIAMYLCKQLTDSSLKTIGLHFGGRDHSTVIHSVRTVEKKYMNDNSLKKHVEILTQHAKDL